VELAEQHLLYLSLVRLSLMQAVAVEVTLVVLVVLAVAVEQVMALAPT
jgi:hypothetical protein